ncbi:MAG: hypothetical protein COB61_004310 [Thiotrichales bacterium]|nr:hypothetical protein [Thiotrichales bacterium]
MNLFDQENYPTVEPDTLSVGDRWAWQRPDIAAIYLAADYALSYVAWRTEGTEKIEISATDFIVAVDIATTTGYVAGDYAWTAYITQLSDNQRITVDKGVMLVKANAATANVDNRTHVIKTLAAIEAVIEKRATKDQESYTLNGRSLARTSIGALLMLRAKYRQEAASQKKTVQQEKGLGGSNKVLLRFNS